MGLELLNKREVTLTSLGEGALFIFYFVLSTSLASLEAVFGGLTRTSVQYMFFLLFHKLHKNHRINN